MDREPDGKHDVSVERCGRCRRRLAASAADAATTARWWLEIHDPRPAADLDTSSEPHEQAHPAPFAADLGEARPAADAAERDRRRARVRARAELEAPGARCPRDARGGGAIGGERALPVRRRRLRWSELERLAAHGHPAPPDAVLARRARDSEDAVPSTGMHRGARRDEDRALDREALRRAPRDARDTDEREGAAHLCARIGRIDRELRVLEPHRDGPTIRLDADRRHLEIIARANARLRAHARGADAREARDREQRERPVARCAQQRLRHGAAVHVTLTDALVVPEAGGKAARLIERVMQAASVASPKPLARGLSAMPAAVTPTSMRIVPERDGSARRASS